MKIQKGEPIRFIITGFIATLIQYAVYYAIADLMAVATAWTIAYACSFICNYILTTYFTFRVKPTRKRALSFACGHLINWSLQMILLHLFIFLGCDKHWAPLPMYLIVMPVNFLVIRFFVKQIAERNWLSWTPKHRKQYADTMETQDPKSNKNNYQNNKTTKNSCSYK